jgi:hypothetical protein
MFGDWKQLFTNGVVYPLTGITSYRIQREDDPAVSNNSCFKQNFVPLPAKKDNLKAEILRTTFWKGPKRPCGTRYRLGYTIKPEIMWRVLNFTAIYTSQTRKHRINYVVNKFWADILPQTHGKFNISARKLGHAPSDL